MHMHTNAYRRPLSPRPHPLHTHSRTHLGKNISARKRVRATDHPFPLSNQQMSNVSWLFSLPCAFPLSLPDARIVFVCERGGEVVVVQAGSSTAQDREKYLYRWFPLRKLFTGCSSLLIFCIMVPDISCCHYPYPSPCIAAGTAAGAATTAAGGSAADAGAAVTAGTIDLGHHHSASLRGTGTKGAAPVPPVPRTGPSMGGCLHACVLSQREGRSAIPPAAGTACMIRTNAEVCCPMLLGCLHDGTESIPHGLIRRMQPQLGEWGATSLTNLPEGDERCFPLHAHLACPAVLASGDGVTVAEHTPCHFP